RPISGQNNSNAYATLFRMPRTVNILDYKESADNVGKMRWYGTTNSINPYWLAEYNLNNDVRNRFLSNANIKYKITDWLDIEGRAGLDSYSSRFENKTYGGSPLSSTGLYSTGKTEFAEKNFTLALHA